MLSRIRHLLPATWPVRIALGAMFIYSAYPKLQDLGGVVESVRAYNVLPDALAPVYGYTLPFVELALGMLLVLGLFTRLAAAGGGLLMVSFIIAIGINLARGDRPECGCFTVAGGGALLDWTTLARDVALLVGFTLPFFDPERRVSLDSWIAGGPGSPLESVDERAG